MANDTSMADIREAVERLQNWPELRVSPPNSSALDRLQVVCPTLPSDVTFLYSQIGGTQ